MLNQLPDLLGHNNLCHLGHGRRVQYYILRGTATERTPERLGRRYVWTVMAAILAFVYVVVLGRGITLRR